ncbi:MAG: hypothetical protein ACJ762_06285 [Solirubrobacteraceae bacterium]
MTGVCVRDLPPDLRGLVIATARSAPGPLEAAGLRLELDRPPSATGSAAYLALADRDLAIRTSPVRNAADLAETLAAPAALAALWTCCGDIATLVCVLDAWDRAFADTGLWPAHVYLAGDAATAELVRIAGAELDPAAVTVALGDLHAAELLYRFPVARRFRPAFGPDEQCRLNGWGRSLAARLAADPHARPPAAWAPAIDAHVAVYHDAYAGHLAGLADRSAASPWAAALALPIPVVI